MPDSPAFSREMPAFAALLHCLLKMQCLQRCSRLTFSALRDFCRGFLTFSAREVCSLAAATRRVFCLLYEVACALCVRAALHCVGSPAPLQSFRLHYYHYEPTPSSRRERSAYGFSEAAAGFCCCRDEAGCCSALIKDFRLFLPPRRRLIGRRHSSTIIISRQAATMTPPYLALNISPRRSMNIFAAADRFRSSPRSVIRRSFSRFRCADASQPPLRRRRRQRVSSTIAHFLIIPPPCRVSRAAENDARGRYV